jgi:hypothetical protein
MLPLILYSINSVADPFLLQHAGILRLVAEDNNINFEKIGLPYLSGYAMILLIIEKITTIKLETLVFSVILGPFFIVNCYILSKELTGSVMNSLLLTIVMTFGFAAPYYSIWPHGWGFLLYLLFLFIYSKIIKTKRMNYLSLLILIFIATNYYSYTAEVWMIFLSLLINIMLLFFLHYKSESRLNNSLTKAIPLVLIIIFLSFNEISYNAYLPNINMVAIFDSVNLFFAQSFGTGLIDQYKYVHQSPSFLTWINVITMTLITFPVFITMMFDLKKIVESTSVEFIRFLCLRWSIALICIVDTIIYAALGVLFLRYILFIFPVLAIASLNIIIPNKQRIITLFLTIVVIFTVISFCWTWTLDIKNTSDSSYSEFDYGAKWLHSKSINKKIISDHYTLSWYQIAFANENDKLEGYYYLNDTFYHLVDPSYTKYSDKYFRNNYVIINQKFGDSKTWAGGWNDFKPINNYDENIRNNVNLHRVYNDGYVSVLDGVK